MVARQTRRLKFSVFSTEETTITRKWTEKKNFNLLFKWLIFRCPSKNNKFPAGGCVSKTAPTIVKKNCDGKSSCVLVASNFALGGDPCFGTHKYLTVTWGCGNVLIIIFTKI